MGEYLPTNDGRPLKTTDAILEWGLTVMDERDALQREVDQLKDDLNIAVDAALRSALIR